MNIFNEDDMRTLADNLYDSAWAEGVRAFARWLPVNSVADRTEMDEHAAMFIASRQPHKARPQ